MCKRMGWPRELIDEYVLRATIEQSSHVVCDRLVLGDPEHKIAAVFLRQPGGAVILCAGLFGDASADCAEVLSMVDEFAANPQFKGKLVAVGEFRPNPKAALQ